ncbi:MAG: type I-C CRISPR-associated protein Cas8c/Csd1 [Roseburia faecis]
MERKFFLLGLSPNSGRLVVNFFLENSFGNFLNNVNDFRKDFLLNCQNM